LPRHRDVLRLLVREAGRPELPERYCERQQFDDRSCLWLALLEIHLEPPRLLVRKALLLLRAHGASLDFVAVLGLLPRDGSLSEMEPVICTHTTGPLGGPPKRRADAGET
jgi:hypothetical protein